MANVTFSQYTARSFDSPLWPRSTADGVAPYVLATSFRLTTTFDLTPPSSQINSPLPVNTTLATSTTPLVFTISDDAGLGRVIVYAHFGDGGADEIIFTGSGSYSPLYVASSGLVVLSPTSTQFSLVRTGGWRKNPTIGVIPFDTYGNSTSLSFGWLYTADIAGPALTVNTPGAGSTLATSTSTISVNVTDATGIARTLVLVKFSTGEEEVAYDGAAFTSGYSAGSSSSSIAGGTRYNLVRAAGWRTNPQVLVESIDTLGNRNDLGSLSYVFTPTPPDTTAPGVTGLTPANGSTLPGTSTAIAFKLTGSSATAPGGAATTFIIATFGGGVVQEVVYDTSGDFSPLYDAASTAVDNGADIDFSITRDGGWGEDPELRIFSIDSSANALDVTYSWTFIGTPAPTGAPTAYGLSYSTELSQDENDFDFGSDILVFPDLDETMEPRTGAVVLGDALARRLTTPRGSLPFHPNYGFDLREYLNSEMTDEELFRCKADSELEVEKDERVLNADSSVSFDPSSETLTLVVRVEAEAGPFKLTIAASQATVSILYEEA